MMVGILYQKIHDGMLLHCIQLVEVFKILHEFHSGTFEGHFSRYTIATKILQVGYYWPSIYINSFQIIKEYDKYHRFIERRMVIMPL